MVKGNLDVYNRGRLIEEGWNKLEQMLLCHLSEHHVGPRVLGQLSSASSRKGYPPPFTSVARRRLVTGRGLLSVSFDVTREVTIALHFACFMGDTTTGV